MIQYTRTLRLGGILILIDPLNYAFVEFAFY